MSTWKINHAIGCSMTADSRGQKETSEYEWLNAKDKKRCTVLLKCHKFELQLQYPPSSASRSFVPIPFNCRNCCLPQLSHEVWAINCSSWVNDRLLFEFFGEPDGRWFDFRPLFRAGSLIWRSSFVFVFAVFKLAIVFFSWDLCWWSASFMGLKLTIVYIFLLMVVKQTFFFSFKLEIIYYHSVLVRECVLFSCFYFSPKMAIVFWLALFTTFSPLVLEPTRVFCP